MLLCAAALRRPRPVSSALVSALGGARTIVSGIYKDSDRSKRFVEWQIREVARAYKPPNKNAVDLGDPEWEYAEFVAPAAQNALVLSAYARLHNKERFPSSFSVFLSGPPGSELLQESLCAGTAARLNAGFVSLDLRSLLHTPPSDSGESVSTVEGSELLQQLISSGKRAAGGPSGGEDRSLTQANMSLFQLCGHVKSNMEIAMRPCILFLKNGPSSQPAMEKMLQDVERAMHNTKFPALVVGSATLRPPSAQRGRMGALPRLVFSVPGGRPDLEQAEADRAAAGPAERPLHVHVSGPTEGPLAERWTARLEADHGRHVAATNVALVLREMFLMGVDASAGEAAPAALLQGEAEPGNLSKRLLTNAEARKIAIWSASRELLTTHLASLSIQPAAGGAALLPRGVTVTVGGQAVTVETPLLPPREPKLHVGPESIAGAVEVSTATEAPAPVEAEAGGGGDEASPLRGMFGERNYEAELLQNVVSPKDIDVRFGDVGALEDCKRALYELVILPLRFPKLFSRGNLRKSTKGVLLFGPPGTGKSMLAKAVASEARATFIDVSASTLTSKWFGDSEKLSAALFAVARKKQPAVIFLDEVDSLLGHRGMGEHEATRRLKNEFMSNWDGLKSSESDRVIVLAASNRPFDLDEAVLRRMPKRLLVDVPDAGARLRILKVQLANEALDPSLSLEELAAATEGYTGSDLKNLCIQAAYAPVRELFAAAAQANGAAAAAASGASGSAQGPADHLGGLGLEALEAAAAAAEADIDGRQLRSLTLDDFIAAKVQVCPSVSEDSATVQELRRWNREYGESGSRRGKQKIGFSQ